MNKEKYGDKNLKVLPSNVCCVKRKWVHKIKRNGEYW